MPVKNRRKMKVHSVRTKIKELELTKKINKKEQEGHEKV